MKPIIFSTPMVQAILDGRKTQTRRIIKPQPAKEATQFERFIETVDCGLEARFGSKNSSAVCDRKPQYKPGDILWVRETWTWLPHWNCESDEAGYCRGCTKIYKGEHGCFIYKENMPDWEDGWCSPIHMPREAARIFLNVTNVRVERLQDINEEDAKAEGVNGIPRSTVLYPNDDYIYPFKQLWNSLNQKRSYGWDKNPWVWVYEFERISKEEAKRLEGMK